MTLHADAGHSRGERPLTWESLLPDRTAVVVTARRDSDRPIPTELHLRWIPPTGEAHGPHDVTLCGLSRSHIRFWDTYQHPRAGAMIYRPCQVCETIACLVAESARDAAAPGLPMSIELHTGAHPQDHPTEPRLVAFIDVGPVTVGAYESLIDRGVVVVQIDRVDNDPLRVIVDEECVFPARPERSFPQNFGDADENEDNAERDTDRGRNG